MTLTPSAAANRIASAIDEKGYAVVTVADAPDGPAFAYTVGLALQKRLPELIVFGLRRDALLTILTHIADVMGKLGPFRDGQRSDAFMREVSCKFRAIGPDAKAEYLKIATAWHRSADYDALQMIWPDKNGAFPDEPGFAPALLSLQPPLWRPSHLI